MIHGAGGGGWEYDKWRPVFQRAGWTVLARDLMPAPGGLANTTYRDYEKQVIAWCSKAKRPIVVIGASMGGGLAQSTSARVKPKLLVLIGSVPPQGLTEQKTTTFPAVVKWANGPFEDTRVSMPDSDEATQRWAWKRWRDESGIVMSSLMGGVDAPSPTCPTLLVWGADDTDVPLATGEKMARHFGADLQVYARTSHVGPLMGKRASEIAGNVLTWIQHRLTR